MIPTESCTYDSNSFSCKKFIGTITDIDALSKTACLSLT